jgi:prevent-host-death family protein
MITVRIAELKSRLSEYLRQVRRGESLTVLDRNTPIARVVSIEEKAGVLKSRPPLPHSPKLQHIPLPPPLRRYHKDIVTYLLEERQVER